MIENQELQVAKAESDYTFTCDSSFRQFSPMPLTITIGGNDKPLALIGQDGIFRVHVDPTDENAKKFIEIVNRWLTPKTLAKIEAVP